MSNEANYLFRERRYNVSAVAETVIWPTIDRLSLRDWRKESEPNMELDFPDRGICRDSLVGICVNASCFIVDSDDAESDGTILRTASFEIKRRLPIKMRDFFIDRTRFERAYTSLGRHAVRASTVSLYMLTTEDDYDRVEYVLLEDDQGGRLATFQDYGACHAAADSPLRLFDHDLDVLSTGLAVLRGSREQLAVLAAMRGE